HHTLTSIENAGINNKTLLYVFPSNADSMLRSPIIDQLIFTGNSVVVVDDSDSKAFVERRRRDQSPSEVHHSPSGALYVKVDTVVNLIRVLQGIGVDLKQVRADSVPSIRPLHGMTISMDLVFLRPP